MDILNEKKIERTLSKYSIIWVWSIILGLNSAINYTFFNTHIEKFGFLNALMILINVISFAFSAMCWFILYKILNITIIPDILYPNPKCDESIQNIEKAYIPTDEKHLIEEIKYKENDKTRIKAKYISFAFYCVIISLIFRFISFIVESMLNALIGY